MKIDLGCGAHKTEGLIGVDFIQHADADVDVIHDLNTFPYPFDEGTVEYVQVS